MGFNKLNLILDLVSQVNKLNKENLELNKKYDIIREEQKILLKRIEEVENRGASVTEITDKIISDAKQLNAVQNSIEGMNNDNTSEEVDLGIFGGSI